MSPRACHPARRTPVSVTPPSYDPVHEVVDALTRCGARDGLVRVVGRRVPPGARGPAHLARLHRRFRVLRPGRPRAPAGHLGLRAPAHRAVAPLRRVRASRTRTSSRGRHRTAIRSGRRLQGGVAAGRPLAVRPARGRRGDAHAPSRAAPRSTSSTSASANARPASGVATPVASVVVGLVVRLVPGSRSATARWIRSGSKQDPRAPNRPSGGSSAPRTPPRSRSGSRSRPSSTCSSTTSSSRERAAARRASRSRSRASSPRSGPATRAPASTPTCSSIDDGVLPAEIGRGGRGDDHPGRARDVRAAAAGRRGAPRRAARSATRRSTSTRWSRSCPIGLGRDGEPLYVNLEFIDGTRGAHVNISGISGVATKTTYATFLLYSLFHSGVLGAEAVNTKALIFNVKGEDLLFLDHAERRARPTTTRERYRTLGLDPRAVRLGRDLRAAAQGRPERRARRRDPHHRRRHRTSGRSPSSSTSELLPFVFADAEDERQQYTMVIHNVARPAAARRRSRSATTARGRSTASRCATYHELVDLIVDTAAATTTRALDWAGRATGMGTINAFVRRLLSSQRAARPPRSGPTSRCRDRPARCAPSGRARSRSSTSTTCTTGPSGSSSASRSSAAFEDKEAVAARAGRCCSSCSTSSTSTRRARARRPIKEILLDVAERGRSLGMILIGAQQTASEVERRVIANSAIRVVGRLDAGRGRAARVRLPARRAPRSGPRSPSRARCSSPSPRSRCRSWSSSRSRRGRPGPTSGRPRRRRRRRVPDDPFAGFPATRREAPPHLRLARRQDAQGRVAPRRAPARCWPRSSTSPRRRPSTSSSSPATCSSRRRRRPRREAVVLRDAARPARHRRRGRGRSRATTTTPRGSRRCGRCSPRLGITVRGRAAPARRRRRGRGRRRARRRARARRARCRSARSATSCAPAELMAGDAAAARRRATPSGCGGSSRALTPDFAADAVNVVVAHCMVARRAARRRRARRADRSWTTGCRRDRVPRRAHYVALGHLHLHAGDPAAPRRSGTRARRSRSTSARPTTTSTCSSSRPTPSQPGRRSRPVAARRPAGGCARSRARSPSCAARAGATGDDVPAGASCSEPGAGRARRRGARAARRRASSRCASSAAGWRRPTAAGAGRGRPHARTSCSPSTSPSRASTTIGSSRCSPAARRGDDGLMRPVRLDAAGLRRVPRADDDRLRRTPTSSRSSGRPGSGKSTRASTRSASRSTAACPATTTDGSSRRSITMGAHGGAGRARPSRSAASEYVAARVVRRTKTRRDDTKEARLERGRDGEVARRRCARDGRRGRGAARPAVRPLHPSASCSRRASSPASCTTSRPTARTCSSSCSTSTSTSASVRRPARSRRSARPRSSATAIGSTRWRRSQPTSTAGGRQRGRGVRSPCAVELHEAREADARAISPRRREEADRAARTRPTSLAALRGRERARPRSPSSRASGPRPRPRWSAATAAAARNRPRPWRSSEGRGRSCPSSRR